MVGREVTGLAYRILLRLVGVRCRLCGTYAFNPYAHRDLEHAGDEL